MEFNCFGTNGRAELLSRHRNWDRDDVFLCFLFVLCIQTKIPQIYSQKCSCWMHKEPIGNRILYIHSDICDLEWMLQTLQTHSAAGLHDQCPVFVCVFAKPETVLCLAISVTDQMVIGQFQFGCGWMIRISNTKRFTGYTNMLHIYTAYSTLITFAVHFV